MDEIKEKNDITSDMIKSMEVYYERAFPLMVGLDYEKTKLVALFTEYDELKPPQNIPEKIAHYFSVFNYSAHIGEIMNSIYNILSSLREYTPDYTSQYSETYINTSITEHRKLIRDFKAKSSRLHTLETSIIIDFVEKIAPMVKGKNEIIEIDRVFYKYYHSVKLYSTLMQRLYNSEIAKDQIVKSIEQAKNYVLSFESEIKCSHRDNTIPITTFGLIPIGDFHINDLLGRLGIASFEDCQSKNMCIILFRRVIKNPIGYNISPLLKEDPTEATIGINKAIIAKFKNIKYLESDPKTKWNFNIEYFGDLHKSQHYVLLCTYNNQHYTFLSIDAPNKVLSHTRSEVFHIIRFLDGNVKTRNDAYNDAIFKGMNKNMFLPRPVDMRSIETTAMAYESKYVRTKIYNNMTSEFMKIIKTEYDNGAKIKNRAQINELIFNPRLSDLFLNIIIDEFIAYLKTTGFTGPTSEISATFYTYIFSLSSSLSKENLTLLNKERIDYRILQKPPNERVYYIQELYEKILKKSLRVIITDSSNIYHSALVKYQLMNI